MLAFVNLGTGVGTSVLDLAATLKRAFEGLEKLPDAPGAAPGEPDPAQPTAVVLDSRGPVFYRQPRVGLFGEPYDIFKIRSMRTDQFNHSPAQLLVHTGQTRLGFPSMGAWVTPRISSGGSRPSASSTVGTRSITCAY